MLTKLFTMCLQSAYKVAYKVTYKVVYKVLTKLLTSIVKSTIRCAIRFQIPDGAQRGSLELVSGRYREGIGNELRNDVA